MRHGSSPETLIRNHMLLMSSWTQTVDSRALHVAVKFGTFLAEARGPWIGPFDSDSQGGYV